MKVERIPRETILACKHKMLYWPAPEIGDLIYCAPCDKWRKAIGGIAREIPLMRIVCKDCQYRRNIRVDLSQVKIKAETHSLAYGHSVLILNERGNLIIIIEHGK